MNTCATCKHYTPEVDQLGPAPKRDIGTCKMTGNFSKVRNDIEPLVDGKAYAIDEYETNAWVYVTPKFGCIHHSPKD